MQNILKIFSQALKATYQAVTLPDDDENDDDDGDRTFRSLSLSLARFTFNEHPRTLC